MKIAPAKIESFIKNPDQGVNAVLFYGPDLGLASDRARRAGLAIVDNLSDPFRVANINFSAIKDDAAILTDEINAFSLTGGRRLIKVDNAPPSLPKNISEIIETSASDSFVIFTAGELSASSSLRKFFESSKKTASIACYKDDGASIKQVVESTLRQQGFNFSYDISQLLSNSFSGDRMVVLSELEKLAVYMGDEKNISTDDVRLCVVDSSEASIDGFCNAVASKNPYEIEKNINRAFADGVSPVALIRVVSRYLMRLELVQEHIKQGLSEQQAMTKLRPPVFYKQVAPFKNHLRMWNEKNIAKVLAALMELEQDCKTTGNPAELMCARFFTILPLAAR